MARRERGGHSSPTTSGRLRLSRQRSTRHVSRLDGRCASAKKIRFRRYEPRDKPATVWRLESKISSVEGRFKTSSPSDVNPHLLQGGLPDDRYGLCRPRVEVSYLRSYFALAGVRITVDRDIGYRNFSLSLRSILSTTDPDAVVELKAANTLPSDFLERLFPWDRTRFSKYCRAVEATLFHGNLRTT